MPRGGIGKNIGCAPRERCRSEPRDAPSPLFYLRHFLARCLTLDPRSLLNRTDALATQAMADRESVVGVALKKKGSVEDRESGVAPCHGVALKKKKKVTDRESSFALCDEVAIKKKKEKNDRSRTGREVSLFPSIWYE